MPTANLEARAIRWLPERLIIDGKDLPFRPSVLCSLLRRHQPSGRARLRGQGSIQGFIRDELRGLTGGRG